MLTQWGDMGSFQIVPKYLSLRTVLCDNADLKNLLLLRVVVIICLTPAFLCSRYFLMAIFTRIKKSKMTT